MTTPELVARVRRNANCVLSVQGKEPADVRQLAQDSLTLATKMEQAIGGLASIREEWGMER